MSKRLVKSYIFSDSIKEPFFESLSNRKNSFKLSDFLTSTHSINNSCYNYVFFIKRSDLSIVKKLCENRIKNYCIYIIYDDGDNFNIPIPPIPGGRRTLYKHNRRVILKHKKTTICNLKDFKSNRESRLHIKKISKG